MAAELFKGEIVWQEPLIAVFTAPNPGFKTLSGTHSYLVGTADAYVIDPGPANEGHQRAIGDWIESRRAAGVEIRPRAILLSHGHPDHAPGARLLKEILHCPVLASAEMPASEAAVAGVYATYEANQRFRVDSHTLQVLAAPGHSRDQVAFWLEGTRILFSGDTILGRGSTLVAPPEGDMLAYMQTLDRFRALNPALILPGHGPLIWEARAKIDEYVEHRRERERQLLMELESGPAGVHQLVERIYGDVDPDLRALAPGSVQAQLDKLVSEAQVRTDGRVYWRVTGE